MARVLRLSMGHMGTLPGRRRAGPAPAAGATPAAAGAAPTSAATAAAAGAATPAAAGTVAPAATGATPAAGATAATGATPATTAAANLKGATLHLLHWSSFVPAEDTFYKETLLNDWAKPNGVNLTVELVGQNDVQPKVAAALQSGSGPD